MKKTTALLLAILSVLLLCSCRIRQEETPDKQESETLEVADVVINETESAEIITEQETKTTEKATETETNANTTESDTLPPANGGSTGICQIHSLDYHSYTKPLIDYVMAIYGNDLHFGDSKDDSLQDYNPVTECPYPIGTMYHFIRRYNIPKDFMIDLVNSTRENYVIELLYADDISAADAYYRDIVCGEEEISKYKDTNYESLKYSVIGHCFKALKEKDKLKEYRNFDDFSCIELIVEGGASISDLEPLIEKVKKDAVRKPYTYDYDLEYFENMSDGELRALVDEHSAYYLDRLFCGLTPYETVYEMQNAEIVGKYLK